MIDKFDFPSDYLRKLKATLLKGISDTPELIFLIRSAFDDESVLVIDKSDSRYKIFYRRKELFGTLNPEDNYLDSISGIDKQIKRSDLCLLKVLFTKTVRHINQPDDRLWGKDGGTYFIGVQNQNSEVGSIWAPHSDSKIGLFRNVIQAIIYSLNDAQHSKKIELSGDIISDVKHAIATFDN